MEQSIKAMLSAYPGAPFLISTPDWFFGPDGQQYQAVCGPATLFSAKEVLGFDPRSPSTNWFMRVGNDTEFVLIAGCRIHYAVPLLKYKAPDNKNILCIPPGFQVSRDDTLPEFLKGCGEQLRRVEEELRSNRTSHIDGGVALGNVATTRLLAELAVLAKRLEVRASELLPR